MDVIVEIRGGLGNQLFCYAFGYALAKDNEARLIIDTSMNDTGIHRDLELIKYQVRYDKRISVIYSQRKLLRGLGYNYIRHKISVGLLTKRYETKTAYIPYIPINIKSSTYFRGYWQNWRYFKDYRDEIVEMLKPTFSTSEGYQIYAKKIAECKSVAVHFRRGDYLQLELSLPEIYYSKAIQQIGINGKKYFVFSDDISYCKEYFSSNFPGIDAVYVDYASGERTIEDMLLMSKCKEMIIANSTFSWWSAYMNCHSKRIIGPVYKKWKRDFYLDSWETIDVNQG